MQTQTSYNKPLQFVYDDGGREAAGYRGSTGDCAVRAAAIITGTPYKEVYQAFRRAEKSPFAHGTAWDKLHYFLRQFEFQYTVTTPEIGAFNQMLDSSLPRGKIIVAINRHVSAVIDHVIHDTFNAAAGGLRRVAVYGYWNNDNA